MLRLAAWMAAGSHAAIMIVGAVVIAGGSPPSGTVAGRATYVALHADAWLAAWLVPPIAALCLLALVITLRRRLDPDGRDAGLSLAVHATTAGVAIEGISCAVAAAVLPALAEAGDLVGFSAAERLVGIGTSTFGNASFTLGTVMLVIALLRHGASRPLIGLGMLNALAGAGYVAVGVAAPDLAPVLGGALLGAVTLFAASIAVSKVS